MTVTEHIEWLNMVDATGPFVTANVLEDVFPQGLEHVETPRRQRLRAAYDEWRDAVDELDPQLSELHNAWVFMVLTEALEYEEEVLIQQKGLLESVFYKHPELDERIFPDFAVQTDDGSLRLLISIYPSGTDLQSPVSEQWPTSPAERMTLLCRANEVRLGLVSNGEEWMLVNAPIGSTSGYATWFARIWWQEPTTLKAFQSLLGMRRAFGPEEDRLEKMLDRSLDFQDDVTSTLGEQVRRAVELLVQTVARADQDRNGLLLRDVEPIELYEAGLTVMMRAVFILCAEEKQLLLLGDPVYDQHYALSTLRSQLREDADRYGLEVLERRHDAWSRLLSVFRAVYGGIAHESLRMPALGGSLFDPDRFPFLEGRELGTSWLKDPASPLPIDNRTVLLLLDALQVLKHKSGAQLLSYRALDVEQIGHVYEGLLEYTVTKLSEESIGLIGTKKTPNPHISVAQLEAWARQGIDKLAEELHELTDRTESSIRKAIESKNDERDLVRLLLACQGNEPLARRLMPFVKLIRADSWDTLLVYLPGTFAITYGGGRRETGSHYTPRALTEVIVEKALEPLVYIGPAEGRPKEEWELRASAQLLDLKVCDPAMGSGAFLVQVCRYLSDALVQAWAQEESRGFAITIDGRNVETLGELEPLPANLHERLLFARRLIAERCIYGVDVNPLAVELAKLSIWLVTLAKARPFSFLNHNLRRGDSILGIHRLEQLTKFSIVPSAHAIQTTLFGDSVQAEVNNALSVRSRMRAIPIKDFTDVRDIAQLHTISRVAIEAPLLIADAIVAEVIGAGSFDKALEERLQVIGVEAQGLFKKNSDSFNRLKQMGTRNLGEIGPQLHRRRHPLHWPLEFPEVFCRENPGFDAIVGNPPFLGNRLWKSTLGETMQWQAKLILGTAPGKIDLCVLFHRRAVELLRTNGTYGLLATTNIAEGSSIEVGLSQILRQGDIFFSIKRLPWPGDANVVVALVSFFKGLYSSGKIADGLVCERIGPRLESENYDAWKPKALKNILLSFEGVNNSQGLAFVVKPGDRWYDVLKSESNTLLRPYVTGDDITSTALIDFNRWALDIADLPLKEIERVYPKAFEFLQTVVQPTRTAESLKSYKGLIDRWWQFWNHRAEQMRAIRKLSSDCVVFSKVTKHPICTVTSSSSIFTNKVVVIGMSRPDVLAICLSSPFKIWLRRYCGGKMEDRLNISITESLNTYPLPTAVIDDEGIALARAFCEKSRLWAAGKKVGMTEVMDLIHREGTEDEVIIQLRKDLQAIDLAVIAAYGWTKQVNLSYEFAEDERLLRSDRMRFGLTRETEESVLDTLNELNKMNSQGTQKGRLTKVTT